MTYPKKRLSIAERWAVDEEIAAESPRELDADPRWLADDLPQYGPNGPAQPSSDDLGPDEL